VKRTLTWRKRAIVLARRRRDLGEALPERAERGVDDRVAERRPLRVERADCRFEVLPLAHPRSPRGGRSVSPMRASSSTSTQWRTGRAVPL
jgi:hypothetical protein